MIQFARRNTFSNLDQSRQRNDSIIAPTDIDVVDVIRRITATGLGLNNHIVLFGVAFITRNGTAAQHGFNGARNHIDIDTKLGSLDTVDINSQFWFVKSQIDIRRNETWIFGNGIHHLPCHGIQILIAVGGLNDEVDGTLAEALTQ